MPAYDLDGRVALVTGAARGIGLACARALHERGAAVALVDRDGPAVDQAAAALGRHALAVPADVTGEGAMATAIERAVERFGGLDVCIANAGIAPRAATVAAMEPAAFERVIDVNLMGTYRTVHAAVPHVAERAGHVALVASIYAFFNGALMSPYAASKAGVEQLGRALRVELAPHGATAGVTYYGFIETEMVRQSLEDPLAARFERGLPRYVRRRLTAAQAADALIAGIERRAARVYAPFWLRPYSAFRGLANPFVDRRMERDRRVVELVREGDSPERAAVPAEGATGPAPAG